MSHVLTQLLNPMLSVLTSSVPSSKFDAICSHTYIQYVHTYNTYIQYKHTYNTYIHTYIQYIHSIQAYIQYIHTIRTIHTYNTYNTYIQYKHTYSTYIHTYIHTYYLHVLGLWIVCREREREREREPGMASPTSISRSSSILLRPCTLHALLSFTPPSLLNPNPPRSPHPSLSSKDRCICITARSTSSSSSSFLAEPRRNSKKQERSRPPDEKLVKLRKLFELHGFDAYIIPSQDPHQVCV